MLHSGNLHQILTCAKSKDSEFGNKPYTVSGVLLATDEAVQPDNHYKIRGYKISVRTLGLNRDFFEIAVRPNGIVESHFHPTDSN